MILKAFARLVIIFAVFNKYLKKVICTFLKDSEADAQFYSAVTPTRNATPKSFNQIPGPFYVPIWGAQWLYSSWFGRYSLDKLHLANEDKFQRYGAIVKEHYLWNFPIIHLFNKKDIEQVLKFQTKFPIRPELEAQCAYRRSRPDRYKSVGLVNAQGQEWHHLRSKLTLHLTSTALGEHTMEQVTSVSDELVSKIRQDRDDNFCVGNFEKYIYRFGLEAIGAILLDQRLGTFNNSVPLMAERLMAATDNLFEVCHEAMYGIPFWKYFPTQAYKKLAAYEDTVYDIFSEMVHNALDSYEPVETEKASVFERIVGAKDVDTRDKIVTLIDLVAAGIETTGNATIFLLYNIVSNPTVKANVYEELDRVLPPSSFEMSTEILSELKYLRACVTESLRLSPIAPNVARILEEPCVFQGYHVPAWSLVVCETWVASLQEENYPQARQFIPDRWLSAGTNNNPFFAVPFGVGKRMCPGKRIAEHEMIILAAKLLQNFDITFDTPVEQVYKFLISPKGPVAATLKDRLNFN